MNAASSRVRIHPLLRTFHWLMAFAIVLALACIYSKGFFAKGTPVRVLLITGHMCAGLAVLGLVLPRLLTRLFTGLPPITPKPAKWQHGLAHGAHLLLYLGMLAVPLLGILFVQGGGKPVLFLGWTLPTLVAPDKAWAHGVKNLHETLGLIMLWLAVAHAAAALWHHRIMRDDTLLRML